MSLLFNKVALITGASRGVGYAAAQKLVEKFPGACIYLTTKRQDVTPQLNNDLRKHLGENGERCEYIRMDVNDKEGVRKVAEMIATRHQTLDILVNNAGIYAKPATHDKELFGKQAKDIVETNYFGLKNVMREMTPMLAKGARVVNMSSHLGHLSLITGGELSEMQSRQLRLELADPDISEKNLDKILYDFMMAASAGSWSKNGWPGCAYTVSKVAVNVYTRILQRSFDQAGHQVIVNSIHPGTFHSKIHQTSVISMDKGAFAVANCACLPESGPRGAVLWHDLKPVSWEKGVDKPSLIATRGRQQ